jgi:hypothetical protein
MFPFHSLFKGLILFKMTACVCNELGFMIYFIVLFMDPRENREVELSDENPSVDHVMLKSAVSL